MLDVGVVVVLEVVVLDVGVVVVLEVGFCCAGVGVLLEVVVLDVGVGVGVGVVLEVVVLEVVVLEVVVLEVDFTGVGVGVSGVDLGVSGVDLGVSGVDLGVSGVDLSGVGVSGVSLSGVGVSGVGVSGVGLSGVGVSGVGVSGVGVGVSSSLVPGGFKTVESFLSGVGFKSDGLSSSDVFDGWFIEGVLYIAFGAGLKDVASDVINDIVSVALCPSSRLRISTASVGLLGFVNDKSWFSETVAGKTSKFDDASQNQLGRIRPSESTIKVNSHNSQRRHSLGRTNIKLNVCLRDRFLL